MHIDCVLDCVLDCDLKGGADMSAGIDRDPQFAGLTTSSPMIRFNLYAQIHHHYFIVSEGIRASLGSSYFQRRLPEIFCLNIGAFKDSDSVATQEYLWSKLGLLGFTKHVYPLLVDQIIQVVHSGIERNPFIKQVNVFDIHMEMSSHYMYSYSEEEFMERVAEQSRLEYEEESCGMVPTAEEFKILKSVKFGCQTDNDRSQICTICLEELEDFASSMPCGHLFHEHCIGKWLDNSHYCPVCRYEMPTETET